jgi:hypothetical protein
MPHPRLTEFHLLCDNVMIKRLLAGSIGVDCQGEKAAKGFEQYAARQLGKAAIFMIFQHIFQTHQSMF